MEKTQARPQPGDDVDSHEVVFELPLEAGRFAEAFFREPLSTFIRGNGRFPGVDHTEPLTSASFPAPGSVRLVCLADGNTADEEVLEKDDRHLRYLVSNYSSDVAAPVLYGVGEFVFEPLEAGPGRPTAATRVRWRYSFKLREGRFPGSLGSLGRSLFRRSFVDGDYAAFMKTQAADIRAFAERQRALGGPADRGTQRR